MRQKLFVLDDLLVNGAHPEYGNENERENKHKPRRDAKEGVLSGLPVIARAPHYLPEVVRQVLSAHFHHFLIGNSRNAALLFILIADPPGNPSYL